MVRGLSPSRLRRLVWVFDQCGKKKKEKLGGWLPKTIIKRKNEKKQEKGFQ